MNQAHRRFACRWSTLEPANISEDTQCRKQVFLVFQRTISGCLTSEPRLCGPCRCSSQTRVRRYHHQPESAKQTIVDIIKVCLYIVLHACTYVYGTIMKSQGRTAFVALQKVGVPYEAYRKVFLIYMRLSKCDRLQANMNVVIQLEDLKEYVGQSFDKNGMSSTHISVFWVLRVTTSLPFITGRVMFSSIISIRTKLV